MSKLDKQNVDLKDILLQASQARRSQDQRVAHILGVKEVPHVTNEMLEIFLDYLKKSLEMPCLLTGIEDLGCFSWEEYYIFGPGSERKYTKLKKKRPSFRDTYEFLNFEDDYDDNYGLMVNVNRLVDNKRFILPLSDLKATEKTSPNYQPINDYVTWFVNWKD